MVSLYGQNSNISLKWKCLLKLFIIIIIIIIISTATRSLWAVSPKESHFPENVNANLIDSIRGGENDFCRQKYGNFLIGFSWAMNPVNVIDDCAL